MRFYFISAITLGFVLVNLPVLAADWTVKMSADATGKELTSLTISKPFWVILTNSTNRDAALMRKEGGKGVAQYLDLSFLFTMEEGKEIPVEIGSFSETWNLTHPELVGPGKSFLIKVDLTQGDWRHIQELKGVMSTKVIYHNDEPFPVGKSLSVQKPFPWTGTVESKPIRVMITQ